MAAACHLPLIYYQQRYDEFSYACENEPLCLVILRILCMFLSHLTAMVPPIDNALPVLNARLSKAELKCLTVWREVARCSVGVTFE